MYKLVTTLVKQLAASSSWICKGPLAAAAFKVLPDPTILDERHPVLSLVVAMPAVVTPILHTTANNANSEMS